MDRCALVFLLLSVYLQAAQCGRVSVGDTYVQTEDDAVQPDGTVIRLTKLADLDCTFEQHTTNFPDGSSSVILKDFKIGKSVLIKADDPAVCYVRDIPEDEIALNTKKCQGELVARSAEDAPPAEKSYVDGNEVPSAELSDRLLAACEGRRLVALVETTTSGTRTAQRRVRRQCQTVTTCTPYEDCEQVCVSHGWWFRSGQCKRYEKTCDTKLSCQTTTTCG